MILPNMSAGNAEKDSREFGLAMAQFIESEWGSVRLKDRADQMNIIDSHMEGTVNVSHLKPMFDTSSDLSSLSINWTYHSELPRMINAVVEGFSYDKYRASVKGIDMHSQEERSKFRREKLKAMYLKDDVEEVSRLLGMDFSHQGYIPASQEELNLYMELEYKQAHELAMELGIQKVFDFSDWRETFNHVAEDLAKYQIAAVKVVKDPNSGVKFEYVCPKNFIYSRDTERTRDFRGAYYFGQYQRLTIGDIERLAGGRLSRKEASALMTYAGRPFTGNVTDMDREQHVDVINFCFKTNRYEIKKKKFNKYGGYKYIDKHDYWQPHEDMRSEMVSIPYEVWYEGIYIPGTEILLSYGLVDNLLRDPSNKRKALSPFVMYRLSSESIGKRIVELSDDIYMVLVKLRHLIVKMRPKGYAIDIDGLGSLDSPDGTVFNVLDQVRIMREDGDLLYSGSSLIDDQQNPRPPIHDMPDSVGRELSDLINLYNTFYQRLHDITGINPQAAGGAPPARTSLAVYEGTISSSQRVVNNIFNGMLSIQKRASEVILARLQTASVLGESKNIIRGIMGEYTTDLVKELANTKYYQYMVSVDVRPTDVEKAELVQSLSDALQTGVITIEDRLDIEDIDNLRLAKQMIKLRSRANRRRAEQMRMIEMQHQSEVIKQQQEAAQELEAQKRQMDAEAAVFENELAAQLEAFKLEGELRKISLTGQWNVAVAKARAGAHEDLEMLKEDRKDDRHFAPKDASGNFVKDESLNL